MWRHWHKPSYWGWWWHERASAGLKAALIVGAVALMIGVGYESSRFLPSADAAKVYTYTHVSTIRELSVRIRTVTHNHVTTTVRKQSRLVLKVIPVIRTVTLPAQTRFVTKVVSRDVTVPVVSRSVVTVTQPVTSTRPVTSTQVETQIETQTATQTVPVKTTEVQTTTVTKTTTVPVTVTQTNTQMTTVVKTVTAG